MRYENPSAPIEPVGILILGCGRARTARRPAPAQQRQTQNSLWLGV